MSTYQCMSHEELCAALQASGPLGEEAAERIAYLFAQEDLLETTQQELKRLRAEVAEIRRPLDAQMARLNQQVIEANDRAMRAEILAAVARKEQA